MDLLYQKLANLVEIPLSQRLRALFSLMANNQDRVTFPQLQNVFEFLYWQEACYFATGKFCSNLQLGSRSGLIFVVLTSRLSLDP